MRQWGRGKEMGMRWLGTWLVALCALAAPIVAAPGARAEVVSDRTAAIIVVPKILVDTSRGIDTLIQFSNASTTPLVLQCFYVNATPTCSTGEGNCITNQRFADLEQCAPNPAISCVPQWQETDFRIVMTREQPIAWLASSGAVDCRRTENGIDNDLDNNRPCFPLDGIFRIGQGGQSNAGSSIPPVAQDPFIGELKCIVVDDNDRPLPRNDVHGHVTIIGPEPGDLSGYNALGIRATDENNGDRTLVLGRPGVADDPVEYHGCPAVLILDHFFDFAVDPITGDTVTTDLTLVPCTEDFLQQRVFRTTVQFLVFNEYEQRFSTSRPVECFREIQLSNIDTMTNNRSIFSAQVAGTLTGQTRLRGVAGQDPQFGNGLMGLAEEYRASGTAAFNIHTQGVRPQKDYMYLP